MFTIKAKQILLLVGLLILAPLTAVSELETHQVQSVEVAGMRRIDAQALLSIITAKPGAVAVSTIRKDVRMLYKTGFFDQVNARLDGLGSGQSKLVYQVTEKPVVRKVFIKGNDEVSESELSGVLNFDGGRFIDQTAIEAVMRRATTYYQSQGFYDVSFTHSTVAVGENEVDVTFDVTEGDRYKIREIRIKGNKELDDDDILDALQTKRYKWWNSWLFGTGRVNPDMLQNDKIILRQFLIDRGFVDGLVKEPLVEKKEDGLYVTIEVEEGALYHYGAISASGDLVDQDASKTLEGIEAESGEVFSGSQLREDSILISDKFGDQGYAFANVTPNTRINSQTKQVDIDFKSDKGQLVSVDRIRITGNKKTYDNVIRRELRLQEQDQFSSSKLKRSRVLLERLGYFDEVSVTTEPGQAADKVNLLVNVREGSTGQFSVGAGYSTSDGAIFNAQLAENNFLGTGRSASINADIGTERENLILSLRDPRVFDSYWAAGTSIFHTEREFDDFDRTIGGANFSVGYPLGEVFGETFEDIDFATKYEYLRVEISEVDVNDAAQLVIDSEGRSTASGITPSITRNTINNPLNPTSGSRQSVSVELAGLGGSEDYYLTEVSNTIYQPLFDTAWGEFIFSMRNQFGYGKTRDDDPFPLFRRYFPGGINSVRGYEARTMGPKDEDGNEYGGSKQFINNFEVLIPLVSSAGVKLVAFYDIGEAFDDDESIDLGELRDAYGYGVRWNSPLGPIRLEFGFPLDREEGEDSMVTLFSFGAPL